MKNFKLVLILLYSFQSVFAQSNQLAQTLEKENYTTIQMQKLATGHHAISTVINDNKGLFIVDTGAITMINDSLLSKYQLEKSQMLKSIEGAGAGGLFIADLYPIKNLILDGFDTKLDRLVTTELNTLTIGLFNANGKLIDGLVGQDVLQSNQAIIDFKTNKLFLKPLRTNEANQGQLPRSKFDITLKKLNYDLVELGTIFIEEFNLNFLTVEIEINGNKGLLIVDSGAGRSMLHSKHFEKFTLNSNNTWSNQTTSGAGGAFNIAKIELAQLNFKQLNLGNPVFLSADLSVLVEFIQLKTGQTIDGVIGQDTLSQYSSVIDVAKETLYMKIKP